MEQWNQQLHWVRPAEPHSALLLLLGVRRLTLSGAQQFSDPHLDGADPVRCAQELADHHHGLYGRRMASSG